MRNHIVLDVFGSQVSLQCGSYGHDGPPLRLTSFVSLALTAHGSTGRARPGSLPHSGVLPALRLPLEEDSDLALQLSYKDASWHDRALAERRRDRRRPAVTRPRAALQRSLPTRPWELDSSSPPAATSGSRLSQSHAGRASAGTTRR